MWTPFLLSAGLLLASAATVAAEPEGFVVLPDGGARYSGPKGRETDFTEILARSEQTAGALGLFRQIIAPKSGPPLHVHHAENEFFYIISGDFNFKLGDRVVAAPAGSIVFVPRDTAHTFQNSGTVPGVLLVGVTPGGLEMNFAERQGVDAETAKTISKKHHADDVGPPLR